MNICIISISDFHIMQIFKRLYWKFTNGGTSTLVKALADIFPSLSFNPNSTCII